MEIRVFRPYVTVIVLMVLTSVALALTVDVNVTDQAGIKVYLPDDVGDWSGLEQRYCHNTECLGSFSADKLDDFNVCPRCGEALHGMTYDEAAVLPGDTILIKKRYSQSSGRSLFVTIVLSGKERASIHRPQMCLTGQGQVILNSDVLEVPLDDRKPLDVMVLDLMRSGPGDSGPVSTSYYAYWFVGKGRETPYHIQRMIWMSTDRILHNVAHRWAYITVSGFREEDSDEYKEEIQEFIRALYPMMALDEA